MADSLERSGLALAGVNAYLDKKHPQPAAGDGVLYASEVAGLDFMRTDLVTLSACQTALGRDVEGEGLLGLSRAFIYAGAQDVLCSLWPVSDESTKILMAWFYDGLKKGNTIEKSLQEAQKKLIGSQDAKHPFFWAGFTAVRGPE